MERIRISSKAQMDGGGELANEKIPGCVYACMRVCVWACVREGVCVCVCVRVCSLTLYNLVKVIQIAHGVRLQHAPQLIGNVRQLLLHKRAEVLIPAQEQLHEVIGPPHLLLVAQRPLCVGLLEMNLKFIDFWEGL